MAVGELVVQVYYVCASLRGCPRSSEISKLPWCKTSKAANCGASLLTMRTG